MRKNPIVYINGQRHVLSPEHSSMMLADYLRYEANLTGTKIVCAEGDCGACTVLRFFPHNSTQRFLAVNSCITPMATLDGSALVTVDQLEDKTLHPVQEKMIEAHGSQCGFCTPGFVMALTGMVEKRLQDKNFSPIEDKEAKNYMTGNLCRCTGYSGIVDAACKIDVKKCESVEKRYLTNEIKDHLKELVTKEVKIETPEFSFFAPTNLNNACDFLKANPNTKIIASATDLGVVCNKRKLELTHLLSLHLISDLYSIKLKDGRITFGARVTLEELRRYLDSHLPEFSSYLNIFASPQIKNNATVVGNIANASPIGDTPPALLALNARVQLIGASGERWVELSDFFQGYRQINKKSDELISAIEFNVPKNPKLFKVYKNSIRKDLDISAVNISVHLDDEKNLSYKIAAGGVAATPIRLKKTENFLKGKKLNQKLIEDSLTTLHSEFNPISDVRASASYRRLVIENLYKKCLEEIGGGQDAN